MIRITTDGNKAIYKFDYDEQAVEVMRTVATRHWHAAQQMWTTNVDWAPLAAKRFAAAGFDVIVDGKPYRPAGPTSAAPLAALFAALPDHLRQPAYRALSKVLHPDTGGDAEWMKQLNQANDTTC